MPSLHRRLTLPYSAENIFEVIANVADYPKFLPFCTNTKIIESSEEELIADTHVEYKMLSGTWRSIVKKQRPNRIEIQQSGHVFKNFDSSWVLTETIESDAPSCEVEFFIHAEAKIGFLNAVMEPIMNSIADIMVEAFSKHVMDLYGE